MKLFCILFLFSILLLCGCSKNSPQGEAAYEFMFSYARSVKKSYGLELTGYGGAVTDTINKFDLSFIGFEPMSQNEVRFLLVDNLEYLIRCINSDPTLKPHLREIPFNINNIKFSISFRDWRSWEYLESPAVARVFISDGILYYSEHKADKQILDLMHNESYQKAKGLVEHQRHLESVSWVAPECT